MSRNKKKKKKLALGDFLVDNSSAIGTGSNLAGSLISGLGPEDSYGTNIASGALSGAGQLAALGPWGMAAGAAIGGTMGAIKAKKLKEQGLQRDEQTRFTYEQMYRQNAGMKHGGKMLANSLTPLAGGELEPISNDAVVVKANDPSKSDSVELDAAFVDHDEVIDKENRVFSDDLFAPSGRTIAKEAKRLEKMKKGDTELRFKDSNAHIDGKLDKLFAYQESMKQKDSKGKFKKGGKMKLANGFDPYDPTLPKYKAPNTVAKDMFYSFDNFGGKPLGSPLIDHDPSRMQQLEMKTSWDAFPSLQGSLANIKKKGPITTPPPTPINPAQKAPFKPDWNKALTSVATFGPNLVSGALQARLKGPAAPTLESVPTMNRMRADAQLNEISRQGRNAQSAINRGASNANDLLSGTGNILAKMTGAKNQVNQNVDNQNADIGNRETWLRQMTKARNAERLNRYKDDSVDFHNAKLQMTSENVANLSGKVLQQGRERKQIELDKQRMDLIKAQFGDSQVLARVLRDNPELVDGMEQALSQYRKIKVKKGGKLPIARKKK